QNGAVCKDLIADYACTGCPAEFGGKNCSVRLTGCDSSPCQMNEKCEALLLRELPSPAHGYRCTCKPGWSGPQCNDTTLASFNGSTAFRVLLDSSKLSTTTDCTFELSFRTSLAHFDLVRLSSHWGDIRVGAHDSSLVLLFFNASSSVIGRADWPISHSLASTDWLTLSVSLTNGSVTLSRSESGVSQLPGAQLVDGLSDSFKPNSRMSVRVGGESGSGIDGGGGFRGCVRDLRLVSNDSTLVASGTTAESSSATWGVCSRSVQCGSPSPCEAKTSSMCSDVWNDFVCHCVTGFGGLRCSFELPSFSLGVGGSVSSASFATAAGVSSVYGGDSWTIELRLVTLSRGAFLLLLGDPSDSATTPRLLVTIDHSGRLSAQLLHSNGSLIAALTSSDSVATGSFVSVKISVSISGRSLSLSVSASVRSASLSSASPLPQLSGQLIIGGFSGASPPSTGGRSKRSLPVFPASIWAAMPSGVTGFRGIISHPRLNEAKPLILSSSPSYLALSGAMAASESSGVVLSSSLDICEVYLPCRNGGTCTSSMASCVCHPGYSGTDCSIDNSECSPNPCGSDEVCLERSHSANYNHETLPWPFNGSFKYETADGYLCLKSHASSECSTGFVGSIGFYSILVVVSVTLSSAFTCGIVLFIVRYRSRSQLQGKGSFTSSAPSPPQEDFVQGKCTPEPDTEDETPYTFADYDRIRMHQLSVGGQPTEAAESPYAGVYETSTDDHTYDNLSNNSAKFSSIQLA
ncbi:hypothetical protein BOX15_Mlig017317g1, partial [Macrostomum lignano]